MVLQESQWAAWLPVPWAVFLLLLLEIWESGTIITGLHLNPYGSTGTEIYRYIFGELTSQKMQQTFFHLRIRRESAQKQCIPSYHRLFMGDFFFCRWNMFEFNQHNHVSVFKIRLKISLVVWPVANCNAAVCLKQDVNVWVFFWRLRLHSSETQPLCQNSTSRANAAAAPRGWISTLPHGICKAGLNLFCSFQSRSLLALLGKCQREVPCAWSPATWEAR